MVQQIRRRSLRRPLAFTALPLAAALGVSGCSAPSQPAQPSAPTSSSAPEAAAQGSGQVAAV
ncbi:hypothetical protein, partial [Glutamicibacter creatinolyticus]|uniref:hypothetical protein n=1 Tax=Glutamicibacter creatinolyticus TaxID=162496 RepID=UPI003B981528